MSSTKYLSGINSAAIIALFITLNNKITNIQEAVDNIIKRIDVIDEDLDKLYDYVKKSEKNKNLIDQKEEDVEDLININDDMPVNKYQQFNILDDLTIKNDIIVDDNVENNLAKLRARKSINKDRQLV